MTAHRAWGPRPGALVVCVALTCAAAAHAATPQPVEIPATALSSSPAPLVGHLFVPASPPPHPAVVMLHGCGGAYARGGQLNARHRMWGEYLASLGYAALMVDSFTSRGLRELCTIPIAHRPLREVDRVGDAYAALAFLRARPGIDAGRIGLLGWSHGGGTVLTAITRKPAAMAGYAAAVAFYPGCGTRAKRADAFRPYAPTLLLAGAADDWTPAAPCEALVAAAAARGEPVSIVTYPDSHHGFDSPGAAEPRVRKDVPSGARPGEGVTTAPNPAAREDALKRVAAFFESHLGR